MLYNPNRQAIRQVQFLPRVIGQSPNYNLAPKGKGKKDNTMNKASASKAVNGAKEAKEYVSIPLYEDGYKIVESGNDKVARYQLGEGVYMDICDGEESDYGCLNLYGVVIKVNYRLITKGKRAGEVFISYPQYKNKAGEYNPYVTNYSKALTDAIKAVLTDHYA